MKTIFNPATAESIITRIQSVNNDAKSQWGKMDAFKMMEHCIKNTEILQGQKQYPRLFIGRIFGKLALRSTLKNDKPMSKNSPTHPELVIKKTGHVNDVKSKLIESVGAYLNKKPGDYRKFVHPFFGKMSYDEVGQWEYKHLDHHLRQFGA